MGAAEIQKRLKEIMETAKGVVEAEGIPEPPCPPDYQLFVEMHNKAVEMRDLCVKVLEMKAGELRMIESEHNGGASTNA